MHIPVLLNEVIEYLNPKRNQNFVDCTLGGGGHALSILSLIRPRGKLLGIDLSLQAIKEFEARIENLKLIQRLILVCDNFANLKWIIKKNNFGPVHGIILDLGLSTDLLEKSGKGFSFMRDESLDMRYNPEFTSLTAKTIVNDYSEKELVEIFKNYGEEKYSWRIAKKIVEQRKTKKITNAIQLKHIIEHALGRHTHIKSLARIFQSLRIVVNDELKNLRQVLSDSVNILVPSGKIVVISYHSLEDRIVKRFFRQEKALNILTKKPVTPSSNEINKNRKSRSAKLRAATKL